MDSLTHIALGACIGELFLGNRIGKRALLYGAIAASLPDIDFVAGFFLDTAKDLLAHRGITHSILFATCMSIFLAWLFRKKHLVADASINRWVIFITVEIFFHLFLDSFNAYGIGLLEPFSHKRFSLNTIFVADPLFSILPGISAIILLIRKANIKYRKSYAFAGVGGSLIYLLICIGNKLQIDKDLKLNLNDQNISYKRWFTTPTPFNSFLWYIVVEQDEGFLVGYHSVLDSHKHIGFTFVPRQYKLLEPFINRPDIISLIKFSNGYFVASNMTNGIAFNVLRFGQINGWNNPQSDFVFHYYVEHPDENRLVLQRGRFAKWDFNTVKSFVKKIQGE